jgi:succinate dehydrogenase flavin-adding protein (antitoxin of CptAB toxin-antitoxin module)
MICVDTLKRKLSHQCQYRGTRELDLIFRNFIGKVDKVDLDWVLFEQFLEEPEPLLMDWLIHKADAPEKYKELVTIISAHH